VTMTLRVYQLDPDTGEEHELKVERYEPTGECPVLGAVALPPCECQECLPGVREALERALTRAIEADPRVR
jgi:hypothetical protein